MLGAPATKVRQQELHIGMAAECNPAKGLLAGKAAMRVHERHIPLTGLCMDCSMQSASLGTLAQYPR